MLVTLSVSQWTARKHDAAASKEVATNHQAGNAGRFNKLLIDTNYLQPIAKMTSALREYHYTHTLPWTDDGRRLLPSKLYFEYTKAMRDMKAQFDTKVVDFIKAYPTIIAAERKRLGTLYNPEDYPPDVAAKFSVAIYPEPVPSGGDLRVDIGADIKLVRAEIEAATQERLKAAMGTAGSACARSSRTYAYAWTTPKPSSVTA